MALAPEPQVRAAVLAGYPALAESLGIDPVAAVQSVGIATAAFSDPDHRISVLRFNRLLQSTAAAGETDGIGLRLSLDIHVGRLGLLGLLLSDRRTVGEAFEVVSRFSQLHNEALVLWTEREGGMLTVHEEYLTGSHADIREIIEMTAGVIALNLRAMIGGDWDPHFVCFRHPRPTSIRLHREIFRCPIHFAADFDGLVCATADFRHRNALAGSGPAEFVRQARERVARKAGHPTRRLTQRLIWTLLPSGQCTATAVARLLGIDRRTLHRHLARDGESFSTLRDAVRMELAARHVRLGIRRLADVATLLGFRSQSDFSHWFRAHFGMSPLKWLRAGAGARAMLAADSGRDAL